MMERLWLIMAYLTMTAAYAAAVTAFEAKTVELRRMDDTGQTGTGGSR